MHELQLLEPGTIPTTGHDVPLDTIVTPDRVVEAEVSRDRPSGIDWNVLSDEKIDAIPLLRRLRP